MSAEGKDVSLSSYLYDTEAEYGVIGTGLLRPETLPMIVAELTEEDFRDRRREAFRIYSRVVREGVSASTEYLVGLFKEKKLDEEALFWIEYGVENEESLKGYIERLKRKRKYRLIYQTGKTLAELVTAGLSPEEINRKAQEQFIKIFSEEGEVEIEHLSCVARAVLEPMVEAAQKGIPLEGIPTPFNDLNRLTGGFREEELILLAARPSVGKTAMALQMAMHCTDIGKRVLFVSLEMSKEQLFMRLLSMKTLIPLSRIRRARLTAEEFEILITAADEISAREFYITDSTDVSPLELSVEIEKMEKLGYKPDIVFVDYLQLMRSSTGGSRQEQVAEISRSLKRIAKKFRIPVVALSQLSRQVEQRADKRPQLSDLRESGALEQDSDLILFIHRPKKEEEKVELIIGKQRNGPIGTVELRFLHSSAKFYGAEHSDELEKDLKMVEGRVDSEQKRENIDSEHLKRSEGDDEIYVFE